MHVVVASAEVESYDFRTYVYYIGYEKQNFNFYMPRPMGDDWLQRINHKPLPLPMIVRIQEKTMFVLFHSRAAAEKFSEWLVRAETEAQEGYRTMRG